MRLFTSLNLGLKISRPTLQKKFPISFRSKTYSSYEVQKDWGKTKKIRSENYNFGM
jgi:hypothetical protein